MQYPEKNKINLKKIWQVNNDKENQAGEFKAQGCQCSQTHAILLGYTRISVQQCVVRTVHEERILNSLYLISIVTWENWMSTTLALM